MKNVSIIICLLAVIVAVSACEGCVNKAAKKATSLGMSAIEGVAEAVSERGDTLSEKITDAVGVVAQGAGRSVNRQLDEHAETVAAVAGRTLVQTVEGLEEGIGKAYCDELVSKETLCSDVSLDFFGKIKEKPVTVASFIITKSGTYTATFDFCNDNCKTAVLTKTAEITAATDNQKTYHNISFAYNNQELALLESAKCTQIIVTRK